MRCGWGHPAATLIVCSTGIGLSVELPRERRCLLLEAKLGCMFVSAAGRHGHDLPRDGRSQAGDRDHARAGATPPLPPTSYTLTYTLSYTLAHLQPRWHTCILTPPYSVTTDLAPAALQVRNALEAGGLEILPEIGISLLSAYHGAQIFEAIGLSNELVDTAFIGTRSRPTSPLALASSLLPLPLLSPTFAPTLVRSPPTLALTRLHPRFAPPPALTREQHS